MSNSAASSREELRRVKMFTWIFHAAMFLSIVEVSRTQETCQEISDCRFYTCLRDRLGCSSDDYLLAYGYRYCHRSDVNRHLFNYQGQQWISGVQQCLISQIKNSAVFMNPQGRSDPCGEVENIAFNSHPNCYTSNGFCNIFLGSDDCTNLNGLWDTVEPIRQVASPKIRKFLKQVSAIASTCSQSLLRRSLSCTATRVYNGILIAIRNLINDCSDSTSNRLDMVFVMDASGSIGANNFESMKTYVANVIRGLNENVRVGVVRYSDSASIVLSLTPVTDPESLASTVEGITYTMGGTNTAAGIALAQSMFEQDRCTGVVKTIAILTDGQSDNVHSTTTAANNAKTAGVQIYASGIGSGPNQNELQSIASSPPSDYLIPVANFSSAAFNNRIGTQQRSACKTPLVSGIGECTTERRLGQYDASYYEHQVPSGGFTFSASVMGEAGIYASYTERNPDPLTADIQTRGSGEIKLFISQPGESNRKKRQSTTTVYVAVISLGEGNTTVNVSSDPSDTTNFAVLGGPIDQTVLLGETANFSCAASGSGNLIFILSHETQGTLTVNEEVGLNADITNSTLTVANTSVESRGVYWCNVTGEGRNIRSHSGVLTVQVPSPKVTIMIIEAQNGVVYAGDNVTLICNAEAEFINVANLSVRIMLEGPNGAMVNETQDLHDDETITISATLASIMPSNDIELYICKAVYTTESDIPYITFEEGSDSVMLNIIVPDPCLSKPCDKNADCKRLEEASSKFSCTCRKPFIGDGFTCHTKNKSITVAATAGGILFCILIVFMIEAIIHP